MDSRKTTGGLKVTHPLISDYFRLATTILNEQIYTFLLIRKLHAFKVVVIGVAIYSLVKKISTMHYSMMSLVLFLNFTLKFKNYLNPHTFCNFIPDC